MFQHVFFYRVLKWKDHAKMKFRHALSLIAPMAHNLPRNASGIATLLNMIILDIVGGVFFGQHSVCQSDIERRVLMF